MSWSISGEVRDKNNGSKVERLGGRSADASIDQLSIKDGLLAYSQGIPRTPR